jgi:hypothetical protein
VVIQITAIRNCLLYVSIVEKSTMPNSDTYAGWWDLSLIDPRNERALLAAFVAAIAVWAVILLLDVI